MKERYWRGTRPERPVGRLYALNSVWIWSVPACPDVRVHPDPDGLSSLILRSGSDVHPETTTMPTSIQGRSGPYPEVGSPTSTPTPMSYPSTPARDLSDTVTTTPDSGTGTVLERKRSPLSLENSGQCLCYRPSRGGTDSVPLRPSFGDGPGSWEGRLENGFPVTSSTVTVFETSGYGLPFVEVDTPDSRL